MSVVIGSQGIVETSGGPSLEVQGQVYLSSSNITGVTPGKLITTTLSGGAGALGQVTASIPGFYFLHNQSTCSLAKASLHPGAEYSLSVSWGANTHRCVLTSSAVATNGPIFVANTGSFGTALSRGTVLTLPVDGSIFLKSDGYYWIVLGGSGSFTIA